MITKTIADSAIAIAEKRARHRTHGIYAGRPHVLIERALMALKSSTWLIVLSGFFEPLFYLLAFGYGIGQYIEGVTTGNGQQVTYAMFIAPALLATSAMNGAIYDSTWNVFFKLRFSKIYDGMMATSLGPLDVALGEISWALARGLSYAIAFMSVVSVMGLVPTWWGILAIPAAVLIAFAFAGIGMAITSYMENFQQMNWVNFALLPMFLFSGAFFPIALYPEWLQWVIKALPLWHGNELMRGIMLGNFTSGTLLHVGYFAVLAAIGVWATTRRLTALFLK
jgi:lipooligosaccharide transport system permease protein